MKPVFAANHKPIIPADQQGTRSIVQNGAFRNGYRRCRHMRHHRIDRRASPNTLLQQALGQSRECPWSFDPFEVSGVISRTRLFASYRRRAGRFDTAHIPARQGMRAQRECRPNDKYNGRRDDVVTEQRLCGAFCALAGSAALPERHACAADLVVRHPVVDVERALAQIRARIDSRREDDVVDDAFELVFGCRR
jgi:hypothetical protein